MVDRKISNEATRQIDELLSQCPDIEGVYRDDVGRILIASPLFDGSLSLSKDFDENATEETLRLIPVNVSIYDRYRQSSFKLIPESFEGKEITSVKVRAESDNLKYNPAQLTNLINICHTGVKVLSIMANAKIRQYSSNFTQVSDALNSHGLDLSPLVDKNRISKYTDPTFAEGLEIAKEYFESLY